MKISIIGGGNLGTLIAATLTQKKYQISLYSSKKALFSEDKQIDVFDNSEDLLFSTNLFEVTDDFQQSVKNADIIFITYPAQMFKNLASQFETLYNNKKLFSSQLLVFIPGTGGVEFAFHNLINHGFSIVGFQRVPYIARLKEYGKSVYKLGNRNEGLFIGKIGNNPLLQDFDKLIEYFFDTKTTVLPNYLSVTLTPSNPILHTTRLYNLFKNYKEGTVYDKNFLFYEEWNDETSKLIFDCDDELQSLCKKIPLDLSNVESLKTHYESETPEQMTRKIKSIKAFKGLTSPMKQVQKNKWIPDFSSRYFTADFEFGLKIISKINKLYNCLRGGQQNSIGLILDWYEKTVPSSNNIFDFNLNQKNFIKLYE